MNFQGGGKNFGGGGQNRFAGFADKADTGAPQQQAPKQKAGGDIKQPSTKKIVVKPAQKKPLDDGDQFENVADKRDGNQRGGKDNRRGRGDHVAGGRRGGKNEDDGEGRGAGRGRGGGNRDGEEGESRRGNRRGGRDRDGNHGGRGRGEGRGQRRKDQGFGDGFVDDENPGQGTGDAVQAGGYRERYQGKPREQWHDHDRQDGTGRGKRGDRKGGAGRGNWGRQHEGEGNVDEEKKGEEGEGRERRQRKPREEEKVAVVEEEEEEVGFTYDDYLASKKTDNLAQAKGREHEKLTDKGIEVNDVEKQRIAQIDNKLAGRDVYKQEKGQGAELLGFGFQEDDEYQERRGGRGGRGGRGDRGGNRGGNRGQRGGRRGGRGGKVIDEEDFPSLGA